MSWKIEKWISEVFPGASEIYAEYRNLAKIAGHSSITITQRYCHPQKDAIDQAFAQYGSAKKWSPTVVTAGNLASEAQE